jgi:hypothetical protein
MQSTLVSQSVLASTQNTAQQGTLQKDLSIFAALGLVAADVLTCKDGIQQLGLGAVRQHGSRVALRVEASAAEEPKPLPSKPTASDGSSGFL